MCCFNSLTVYCPGLHQGLLTEGDKGYYVAAGEVKVFKLSGQELTLRPSVSLASIFSRFSYFEFIFCHPVQYVVETVGNDEEEVIYVVRSGAVIKFSVIGT